MAEFDLNVVSVQFTIGDVSSAGQMYIPISSETAGEIVEIRTALGGAISGANAGLTAKINGTAVTGGTIAIAHAGSAAGDIDSCAPTAANVVVEGDNLEIETDGASTGAQEVTGIVKIRR